MSSTETILIALLIIYIPIWVFAFKSPKAKKLGLEIWGPAIKINTRMGLRLMDRLAVYHRFWRAFGVFSQIVSLGLMAIMVVLMVLSVVNLPNALGSSRFGLEYALAIPGLNPIMPFWYTLLAFIVALVCHELAHGLQARTNGMEVVHTGLLYGVVPLGAFVEPKEEDVRKAARRPRNDLYAAGITTNFVIAAVSFLVFSTVLLGGVSSPYEDNAGVYANQDADGIPAGAMITSVDGIDFVYSDIESPRTDLLWELGVPVTVTYDTEHEKSLTKTVVWGLRVAAVTDGSAAQTMGISAGDTVASVRDSNGVHYFYTASAFTSYMSGTVPGENVTVTYYDASEGSVKTASASLGSGSSGVGFLGISTTTAGMSLLTPADVVGMGSDPLYGRSGLLSSAQGLISYLSYPFSGFTPIPDSLHWWYDESFPGFWSAVSIFYWMFWLNILLGVTNALPAVPFDGGYVFRGWVDGILERLGNKDREAREAKAEEITRNVSGLVLFMFLLVIIAVLV